MQQCLGCCASVGLSALAAAVTSIRKDMPAVVALEVCFMHTFLCDAVHFCNVVSPHVTGLCVNLYCPTFCVNYGALRWHAGTVLWCLTLTCRHYVMGTL